MKRRRPCGHWRTFPRSSLRSEGVPEAKRWMAEVPSISQWVRGAGALPGGALAKAAMIAAHTTRPYATRPLPVALARALAAHFQAAQQTHINVSVVPGRNAPARC